MDKDDPFVYFGGLEKFLTSNVPTRVKAPKHIQQIQDYAARLWFEDQIEREARTNGLSHVVIYPDTELAGKWTVTVFYKRKSPPSNDPFASILGGGSSGPMKVTGKYSYFEQADAWLEKNNYFGLKNTKYQEGIYASWG